MSDMLDAALDYASRGWPIFPLAPNSKEPLANTSGVLDATTDPGTIRKWWTDCPEANIGLDVGGAGMMVLDLDPGHDPAALDASLGKRPHTGLRQRTPRGGTHEFYSLADGEHVPPSASKLAPNVDVRSFHSYVVLAPSYVDDGKAKGAYEWENDDWPAPKAAYRSDRMAEACQAAREKHGDRDKWIIEPDLPEHVERCIRWLKGDLKVNGQYSKVAVSGKGGDHCAYATAAMCKSFGISPALAFDLMLEHWNPRCDPPWSEGELDHLQGKIENAYAYNTSPPGNMTDAYKRAKTEQMFQPVSRDAEAGHGALWTAGRFRIVDREAMEEIRDPSWLVPDLLPEQAYAMLVGAPGTLKTFVALDIALAIATGTTTIWPGITSSGPVLFAVGEGRHGLKHRVAAWEHQYNGGRRVPGSSFWLVDPVPAIAREGEVEGFIQLVKHAQPEPFRLVVIDTVGRAMQGVNENAQEHASAFTAAVELIQKELGCAVLAIHHSGHDGSRARGSSVFGADVDTLLIAEREGKAKMLTLTMAKQKDAAEWEKPRAIGLSEVGKSLVVSPPTPEQARVAETPVKARQEAAQKGKGRPLGLAPELVDAAAVAVLGTIKGGFRSTRDLADMIAANMGSGVSASTIRKTYLANYLQCDARFKAHALYDAATKRWRCTG